MNLVEFIKIYKVDTIIGLLEIQESDSLKLYKLFWSERSSLDLSKKIILISKEEPSKGKRRSKVTTSASNIEDHASYFYKVFGLTPSDFLSQTDHAPYLDKGRAFGISPVADNSDAIDFLLKYCRMIVFFEPFTHGEHTKYTVVTL